MKSFYGYYFLFIIFVLMTLLTIVVSDINTENDEDMETDIPVSYLTFYLIFFAATLKICFIIFKKNLLIEIYATVLE